MSSEADSPGFRAWSSRLSPAGPETPKLCSPLPELVTWKVVTPDGREGGISMPWSVMRTCTVWPCGWVPDLAPPQAVKNVSPARRAAHRRAAPICLLPSYLIPDLLLNARGLCRQISELPSGPALILCRSRANRPRAGPPGLPAHLPQVPWYTDPVEESCGT